MKMDDAIYYVVDWETGDAMKGPMRLATAKRLARGEGHLPASDKTWSGGKWLPPVAFVGEKIEVNGREVFGVTYNPRFKNEQAG